MSEAKILEFESFQKPAQNFKVSQNLNFLEKSGFKKFASIWMQTAAIVVDFVPTLDRIQSS